MLIQLGFPYSSPRVLQYHYCIKARYTNQKEQKLNQGDLGFHQACCLRDTTSFSFPFESTNKNLLVQHECFRSAS